MAKVPNEVLELLPSIGTNRIYTRFVPTDYVCTNPLVLEQCKDDIKGLNCNKHIRDTYAMDCLGQALYMANIPFFFVNGDTRMCYEGYTVTFVAMQIAFWKGYENVLLVGLDHNYPDSGNPNQEVVMVGEDRNHFDSAYFPDGFKWNYPDLAQSENSYRLAQAAFTGEGRRIYNCTPGTHCDVFEKTPWMLEEMEKYAVKKG